MAGRRVYPRVLVPNSRFGAVHRCLEVAPRCSLPAWHHSQPKPALANLNPGSPLLVLSSRELFTQDRLEKIGGGHDSAERSTFVIDDRHRHLGATQFLHELQY
jgi:hypothetical protein